MSEHGRDQTRESTDLKFGNGTGARVLRELIKTPVFMEIIKYDLANVDPERARGLIESLLWADPNLSLSLIGFIPDLLNYLIECLLTLGKELGKFTPEMLGAFLGSLGQRIETDRLKEVPAVYGSILKGVSEADPDLAVVLSSSLVYSANSAMRAAVALIDLILRAEEHSSIPLKIADGAALGRLFTGIARFSGTLFSDERFVMDFLRNIDWKVVLKALFSFVHSFYKAITHILRGKISKWGYSGKIS